LNLCRIEVIFLCDDLGTCSAYRFISPIRAQKPEFEPINSPQLSSEVKNSCYWERIFSCSVSVCQCHSAAGVNCIALLTERFVNPLNPELNPICYLLALLAHHFLHISRIRVKLLTFRLLMSYIHGASILDVSRSHTTTQHSR